MTETEQELADMLKWVAFVGWKRCAKCGDTLSHTGASSSSRDKAVQLLDRVEPGWREDYLTAVDAKYCPCSLPDDEWGD